MDLTGLPGGRVIHQSLPLGQQWPCLVFFSCLLGSPSDAWGCCSSPAGTLDTLVDSGDINLFMQVVLRAALSLMVTELSLYHMSLASFSLFSYLFTLPGAISIPCAFLLCMSQSGFGFGFGVNLCSSPCSVGGDCSVLCWLWDTLRMTSLGTRDLRGSPLPGQVGAGAASVQAEQ